MPQAVTLYSREWWISQLDKDEKRLKDKWWLDADKIVKKYKGIKSGSSESGDKAYWLNLFWSNVGVMKAALYGKRPKPLVNRIWSDPNDNIARVAGVILERCLAYDLTKNECPMDQAIKLAVEDWLVPGLGEVWLRYEAETEKKTIPGTPIEVEVVSYECVHTEYVPWRDLVWPSSRTEFEVWYLGRRVYLAPAEVKKLWGITVPSKDERKPTNPDNTLPENFVDDKVCIYEVWNKKNRKVYWFSRDIPDLFVTKDDFLNLEGFYPCPMPLMATHTTDDYLPRPDYVMMKDQYDQLNELNTRIVLLEKALRVVGVYDKKNAEVQRILSEARENDMIPVDKWAVLGEAGGLKGVVDWFPIEMISNVMEKLREQKAEKKQEIYELSGISDIMRGSSNPRETLGAQKLKAQFGSVRLQLRQDEVSVFVRQALTIKAELMCEHFQPQTLMRISNILQTSDAQYAEQAIQLLKDYKLVQYRVDISEQNLALPDYQQEQESRMEFLTTVGQFMSQAAGMVQAVPGALPHLIGMIRWCASGFRSSNEIQGVLDQAMQAAQNNPPPPQQGKDGAQPVQDLSPQTEQIKQQGEIQKTAVTGEQKLKEIKLSKDLELRNRLEEIQAKAMADMKVAGDEARAEVAQMGLEHRHDLEATNVAHQNSLEQGEQSGNLQLEVSRMRGAGGNGAAD
jgi:hypothetical protein